MAYAELDKSEIILFIALIFVVMAEVSFISFFIPVGILIKSLILVFVYYLYWGALSSYIGSKVTVRDLAKYILVFLFLSFVIFINYLWGGAK